MLTSASHVPLVLYPIRHDDSLSRAAVDASNNMREHPCLLRVIQRLKVGRQSVLNVRRNLTAPKKYLATRVNRKPGDGEVV